MHDYYQILNVPPTATLLEIKLAYHSSLLKHHPDKNKDHSSSLPNTESSPPLRIIDISLLKEAYTTLSAPLSRSQYDISLKKSQQSTAVKLGPRPAQIVSLEDFTQLHGEGDVWEYPCRCGSTYRISESEMDKGQHLVGCRNCSEAIWVGYELVNEDNDNGDHIS